MKSTLRKVIFGLLLLLATVGYPKPVWALGPPDKKVEAQVKQGDKHFAEGFYFQAIQYYQQALVLAPQQTYVHYQLAECYRNLIEYQKAKPHYEAVYQTGQTDYPAVAYYLGVMHKLSGEYAQSVKYFDAFIAFAEKEKFPDSARLVEQATLEKEGSLLALHNTMKPKGAFAFTRLPEPVNSTFNDYAATPLDSASTILITSTRNTAKGQNINNQYGEYYSDHYLFGKNEAGQWQDITKPAGIAAINTNYSEGTGVFSPNKTTFYFTGCYQEGYCHLYKSEYREGKWQEAVPLGEQINLKGYDSKQPSISAGGDTLFFVSNRPGGLGQQDIWLSSRAADGNWQPPQNLGAGINTAQNELSPFYHPLEKVLLFSSNGHKGYGGFDVFFSPVLAGFTGLTAINLGLPFNSFKDDLYLSLGNQVGYLSSNRDNADGNFDVYTFSTTASQAVLLSLQRGAQLAGFGENFKQFFSEADRRYFEELPLEEKTKVQRYVEQQSFRRAMAEKAALSQDMQFFYNSLPTEEKTIIERLAVAKQQFLLNETQDQVLAADQYYYENLPLEKKEKIRQIIEKRAFQKILQESSPADAELALFYETLPLEERQRINRAIDKREIFIAKAFLNDDGPTLEDLLVYHTLPTEEKNKIERMVQARLFQKEQAGNSELKYEEDLIAYEQLPTAEKQRVDRMVNARRFAAKAAEDGGTANLNFKQDYLNLGVLAASNPENITIEGKILANNQPAKGVNVTLASGQKAEKTTITNERGEFSFVNVNYHKDQNILFDREAGFLQLTNFNLEELRVIVLQDTVIHETFDNIYFETDKYYINDSSKVILDRLADFHFRYPDVLIEISGFADTTGGEPYNKQLSFKRASQALTYLSGKGVNPAAVQILPKGKEITQEGKDLQYSRRIEFALRAVSSAYNPTREIFVISPRPNLSEIAHRYQLSPAELAAMNPQLNGEPAPFTPIRVLSRRK